MRRFLVIALLLLCLPMVGEGQSIRYYPGGGGGAVTVADVERTTVATSGTVLEALHTLTIPANSMAAIGDFCEAETVFVCAANGNNKIVRHYWGTIAGTNVSSLNTAANNSSLDLRTRCRRTSASTIYCTTWGQGGVVQAPANAGGSVIVTGVSFTADVTFTAAGLTATSASDVSAVTSLITCTKASQ